MYFDFEEQNLSAVKVASLESSYIASTVSAIHNFFPAMAKMIGEKFSTVSKLTQFVFTDKPENLVKLSKEEQAIVGAIQNETFDSLSKLRVAVPEGMVGNYVSYGRDLLNGFGYHEDTALEALETFYIMVAAIITNKDAKISLKDNTRVYEALERSRKDLNKKLASYFIARSTQPEQEFKKVFSRKEEVEELFKLTHELKAKLEKTKVDEVKAVTEKITDAIATLIKLVEEEQMDKLSAAQYKNITKGAYEMAYQVEMFSVNYYRALTYVNSVDSSKTNFKRRLDL